MTVKHSPAPWTLSQHPRWPFCLTTTAADGRIIAVTDLASVSTADKTTAEANAREGNAEVIANETLRAAAPDLLAALEAMTAYFSGFRNPEAPTNKALFGMADAAIAAARGFSSSTTEG